MRDRVNTLFLGLAVAEAVEQGVLSAMPNYTRRNAENNHVTEWRDTGDLDRTPAGIASFLNSAQGVSVKNNSFLPSSSDWYQYFSFYGPRKYPPNECIGSAGNGV